MSPPHASLVLFGLITLVILPPPPHPETLQLRCDFSWGALPMGRGLLA